MNQAEQEKHGGKIKNLRIHRNKVEERRTMNPERQSFYGECRGRKIKPNDLHYQCIQRILPVNNSRCD